MKPTIYALSALLALGPGSALATNCSTSSGYDQLDATQLLTLVTGNTACYPAAGGPPWTNQELHSGGSITDYKKGPGDPVDPSTAVGTYAISGTGSNVAVTYSYAGGGSYSYQVFGNTSATPGTYDFCTGGSPLAGQVRINAGGGPC